MISEVLRQLVLPRETQKIRKGEKIRRNVAQFIIHTLFITIIMCMCDLIGN